VFILGAARSGTSAIAHALLAAADYEGNEEGHLFDMLAPLELAGRRFNASKADERLAGRNTTVARVPRVFIDEALNSIVVTAARLLFPTGRWLDKTPSTNMVFLAPRFRRIWPNARFVFMKRRAVENGGLASSPGSILRS
jgi:sulfotransferase family protein